MPANSERIRISLDLPAKIYYALRDVTELRGITKMAYVRKLVVRAVLRDVRRMPPLPGK